jgi:hypothetical protein
MISQILCNKVFEEKPPVLIDVGASGPPQALGRNSLPILFALDLMQINEKQILEFTITMAIRSITS